METKGVICLDCQEFFPERPPWERQVKFCPYCGRAPVPGKQVIESVSPSGPEIVLRVDGGERGAGPPRREGDG